MPFNEFVLLSKFFSLVINSEERHKDYAVYGIEDPSLATANSMVFISEAPDVDEFDREVFPIEVKTNKVSFWYLDELIQDVIDRSIQTNKNICVDNIIEAINYYLEHDSFIE